MRIAAIDPGTDQSGFVTLEFPSLKVLDKDFIRNEQLLAFIRSTQPDWFNVLIIERIEHYGMRVGREVFDTCYWSGKFAEAYYPGRVEMVSARETRIILCGTARAKKSEVHQAVRDWMAVFHKVQVKQLKGTKKNPGPLYGFSNHMWSALGLIVTYIIKNYSTSNGGIVQIGNTANQI